MVTVAVVLPIVQNGNSAHLNWLTFHFSTPLWIMRLTAAAGVVVWEVIKVGSRLRSERRAAVKAGQELTRH